MIACRPISRYQVPLSALACLYTVDHRDIQTAIFPCSNKIVCFHGSPSHNITVLSSKETFSHEKHDSQNNLLLKINLGHSYLIIPKYQLCYTVSYNPTVQRYYTTQLNSKPTPPQPRPFSRLSLEFSSTCSRRKPLKISGMGFLMQPTSVKASKENQSIDPHWPGINPPPDSHGLHLRWLSNSSTPTERLHSSSKLNRKRNCCMFCPSQRQCIQTDIMIINSTVSQVRPLHVKLTMTIYDTRNTISILDSMRWFTHRRSRASEDRSRQNRMQAAINVHYCHPQQSHNGVVCCCMQRTAYSARVALPCTVNGDDSTVFLFFFVHGDLDLWPPNSNWGKIFVQCT